MVKIVGVRFRNAGKVYYFDPKDYKIKPGDHVIVETARGIEYGTVTGKVQEISEEKVVQPLKTVVRVANGEDDARAQRNREKEREAMAICKEKIRKHNLEMKLIDAEYTFDNNKVLFYFTADGRIDFRELVKDLAAVFRTRIELRQIGVRDETKILGGIGICGRQLCCSSFLSEFAPVSIKMAKEQNLSLNPDQDLRSLRQADVLPEERGRDVRVPEQQTAGSGGYRYHTERAAGRGSQRQRTPPESKDSGGCG